MTSLRTALPLSLLLLLPMLGCEARIEPAIDDEPYSDGQGSEGSACTGDAQRCEGNVLRRCFNGRLRTKQICPGGMVCDDALGCVDCSPKLATSCQGDDVRACRADGSFGDFQRTCDPGLCKGGSCANVCPEEADLIYVVDEQYRLLSFNPKNGKNEFKLIGNLNCSARSAWGGGTATPFSMSVDREAKAWVLYNSGEIFWVSTKDASCKPSGFMPGQNGFETFGMGFVSDTPGSQEETLFITGGSWLEPGRGNVGSVDKKTLKVTKVGALPNTEYGPELTGTGKAELWGYFPGDDSFVTLFDKATGKTARTWPLPPIRDTVRAWAFAHWGGRFYIFVTTDDGLTGRTNSQVIMFNPLDGKITDLLDNQPYIIVGAGVSTCAPIVIG